MKRNEYENPKHREHREFMAKKDREYREIVKDQQVRSRRIAQDLMARNPLSIEDSRFAARIILFWEGQLSGDRKRRPGRPPAFDHMALVFDYWELRHDRRMAKAEAFRSLAEQYETSEEFVRRLIDGDKKNSGHGEEVREFLGLPPDEPTN